MTHTKGSLLWPDSIRLEMIEKSKFYPEQDQLNTQQVYQFGYYDGWQRNTPELLEALKELLKETPDYDPNDTRYTSKYLARIGAEQAIKNVE